MVHSKDGQGHKDKYLDTSKTILSQEMLMCNMKALIFIIKNDTESSYHKDYSFEISKLVTHYFKFISKIKIFKKWFKLQGQCHCVNKRYPRKDFITRYAHVKYKSSSIHCSKVISKAKVFKKWVKLQGQSQRVKNEGTHGNVENSCDISKLWHSLFKSN